MARLAVGCGHVQPVTPVSKPPLTIKFVGVGVTRWQVAPEAARNAAVTAGGTVGAVRVGVHALAETGGRRAGRAHARTADAGGRGRAGVAAVSAIGRIAVQVDTCVFAHGVALAYALRDALTRRLERGRAGHGGGALAAHITETEASIPGFHGNIGAGTLDGPRVIAAYERVHVRVRVRRLPRRAGGVSVEGRRARLVPRATGRCRFDFGPNVDRWRRRQFGRQRRRPWHVVHRRVGGGVVFGVAQGSHCNPARKERRPRSKASPWRRRKKRTARPWARYMKSASFFGKTTEIHLSPRSRPPQPFAGNPTGARLH